MSQNRGKSISDCQIEIMANDAYLRHVEDPKIITKIRKQNTALRNRIRRLNEKTGEK